MTTNTTVSMWQPPSETLESIASVLMSHWRAAKAHPERLFWPGPASWLHDQAMRLAGACPSNDRRHEGDPHRADFGDRFARIVVPM